MHLSHEERESLNVLQCNTSTLGNAVQWVFSNMEGDADFILKSAIETTKQRATTSEIDTISHDVGIQFGWSVLQSREHSIFNFAMVLSKQ